jgi:hypothetical protein
MPTASKQKVQSIMADVPVLQIRRGEGGDWLVARHLAGRML